jgi:predicted ester cyclase
VSDSDVDLVRRFWSAFNNRDLTGLKQLFADEYVNHAALPGTPPGPEGQAQLMERLWHAFPDAHFSVEHIVKDDDTVICIGTLEGTHEGELMGLAPTHRKVQWKQCHLIRVSGDGKALEHRAIRDDVGLMRQMGIRPGG